MATHKEIKTRINAIKSTQKITKAMKMVAAAKLRKAQDRILLTRPYALKLNSLVSKLIAVSDLSDSPFAVAKPDSNNLIIVISSDRGLCGSFNSNVIKYTANYLAEIGKNTPVITVGKKINDYLSKRNYNVIRSYNQFFLKLNIQSSNDIVKFLIKSYLSGEFGKIEIIYNEFKSVIKQNVTREIFLPFTGPSSEALIKEKPANYIFEPGLKPILEGLIPKLLRIQFWKALLESNAAEQGARMTAMEMATKNAQDLMQYLELMYNRARQESITKELLEIVSGAEALKEG